MYRAYRSRPPPNPTKRTLSHSSNCNTLEPHKFVFVNSNEDCLFSSPNSCCPPSLPPPTFYGDLPDAGLAQQAMWADNMFVALALVPIHLQYRAPFDVLRPCFKVISPSSPRWSLSYPIVPDRPSSPKWRLDRRLAAQWRRLQNNLITLATILLAKADLVLPVDFAHFPLPTRYGTNQAHNSELDARASAENGADAFRVLMAWCSLLMLTQSTLNSDGIYRWEENLYECGVPIDEITMYRHSDLANFTRDNPRAGVLFRPGSQILHLYPLFIKAHAPVWFLWDIDMSIPKQYEYGFDCFRPTAHEVSLARASLNAVERANREIRNLDRDHEEEAKALNLTLPPRPHPGSHQHLGETIDDYFTRLRVLYEERVRDETAEERNIRVQQEKEQARFPCPSETGLACWIWEKDDSGFWLKRPVTFDEVREEWAVWVEDPQILRYDVLLNEWNICEAWASGAPIKNSVTSDPVVREASSDLFCSTWEGEHRWHNHFTNSSYTVENEVVSALDLIDALSVRFGFLSGHESFGPVDKLPPWHAIRRTMGDAHSYVPESEQADISAFVTLLAAQQPSSIPACSWDIVRGSFFPFQDIADSSMRLIKNTLDGGAPCYIIAPRISTPSDPEWQLVLSDAATVLQCFREHVGPRPSDVVQYLVSMGIPFRTCIRHDQLPAKSTSHCLFSLGWRPQHHKPRPSEYPRYEAIRWEFLRRSYARAAVLQGGIVWRLTVDSWGLREAGHWANNGPSRASSTHGCVLKLKDGTELHDDNITEQEMNLICGVYKLATGNSAQTADISWWPKQNTFITSGMWVGYWTPNCEDWFQGRLQQLRSGNAKMRNSREWRTALTLAVKTTSKVMKTNSVAAAMYLDSADADFLSKSHSAVP